MRAYAPAGARVSRNLWYEGLVLHARVLRDFFFTKVDDKGKPATRNDDILAADYLPRNRRGHTRLETCLRT
jgi:hypothetical protein